MNFTSTKSHVSLYKFLIRLLFVLSLTSLTFPVYSQVYTGQVFFSNQTQVDTFPPYTEVTSDLIIAGTVTNVDSLYRIKKIGQHLIIRNPENLVNVDGLYNLDTIGFDLSLDGTTGSGTNHTFNDLTGLSGLRYIGRELRIREFDGITDLNGLDNVNTIAGTIWIEDNASLETLVGLSSVDSLWGVLIKDNPSLKNVDGLSSLKIMRGSLSIEGNPQLQHVDGLSSLTTCWVNLTIVNNPNLVSISGLSSLNRVDNSLGISGAFDPLIPSRLKNLNGLGNLRYVGELGFTNFDSLVDVSGLSGLTTLKEELWISSNKSLENLDGWVLPSTIGPLNILNNAALKNIDGLAGVNETYGIRIEGNPQLMNIDGLSNVHTNDRYIQILNNASLQNLEGLLSITSLGDPRFSRPTSTNIVIANNANLSSLRGLDNISNLIGSINIRQNPSLREIDALGQLDSINGGITMFRNWSLSDVYGLRNLRKTGLPISISFQPMLNDCCGLYTYLSSLDSIEASRVIGIDVGLACTVENILLNGPCEAKKPYVLKGSVYLDANDNCLLDSVDFPLVRQIVVAQPGANYGLTDLRGEYVMAIDTGTYTIATSEAQRWETCDSTLSASILPSDSIVEAMDMVVQGNACPDLSVDIGGFWNRRCFSGTIQIQYCNRGILPASQSQLTVTLPEYLEFISADKAHSFDADSNLVFDVGTLAALACYTLSINTKVSCESEEILGLTQCVEATLNSPDICPPAAPNWSGASLSILARCVNNLNRFLVVNVGNANMTDSSEYRLYADTVLVQQGMLFLNKGGSLEFDIPGTGQMFRLEVDQVPNHPRNTLVSAALEGCVATLTSTTSKGMIPKFAAPIRKPQPSFSVDCQEIIGSYDPNDKQVFPRGMGDAGLTLPGNRLEYLIRFQNTGTDTAFNIMIVDTLSADLDLQSFQLGASSHPFEFELEGTGQAILRFRFENILLPDSNVNEPESHGFVKFSIDHVANAPLGTEIENFADIFFDFNLPIRTNTVINTLSDFQPESLGSITGITQTYYDNEPNAIPEALQGRFQLYPNPVEDKLFLSLDGFEDQRLSFVWLNIHGSVVHESVLKVPHPTATLQLDLPVLPPGVYLIEINQKYTRKILIR